MRVKLSRMTGALEARHKEGGRACESGLIRVRRAWRHRVYTGRPYQGEKP